MQQVRPEAVYIGSARATLSEDLLPQLLESIISSGSPRLVLVEPASVRNLTITQASELHDLARTHSASLSLPIRWNSLFATTIDETLLGLELLQDVEAEQSHHAVKANGNGGSADVSVDKSFDVSMSNIPTGLSHERLDELAELDAIKEQLAQLKRDLSNKDKRIAELVRQTEENRTKSIPVEPVTPGIRAALPAARTPSQPPALSAETAFSPATAEPQTPISALKSHIATSTTAPVPPSSSALAQLSSPAHLTSSPVRTPGLEPALPISSPSTPASPASRSSGKVIAALTSELAETKSLLEATRSALATVKAQSAQFQAQADEMRGTLSRARLENDSSVGILARKDRQVSEALERARKAEGEARELGRASREWGTRVREVEEELGKERMKRSRAEQQYESLSSEWKTARERLREEVAELRTTHAAQLVKLSEEYKKVLTFKYKFKEEWSGYTSADSADGKDKVVGPQRLVAEITSVNTKMEQYLQKEVKPLMEGLKKLEARENREIVDKLKFLTDELTRIKTLMRRGDITSSEQVPPGPL